MPTEIYLVKVGMTMTEGAVEEWYIADGAEVKQGELLYRLETEKVNLDVDAEVSGIVKHVVPVGEMRAPGDVVGYIYQAGEAIPDSVGGSAASATAPAANVSEKAPVPSAATNVVQLRAARSNDRLFVSPAARRLAGELNIKVEDIEAGSGPNGRVVEADVRAYSASAPAASNRGGEVRSSPAARRLAREMGVDLQQAAGSGPGGRVTLADVQSAASRPPSAPVARTAVAAGEKRTRVSGMRKTIATRMHQSLQSMAQLSMDMDVLMDDCVRLREQLIKEWEAEGVRVSYTDLVIRAVAKALRQHPLMNAEMTETEIIEHGDIHVGMAVALDTGLVVPVIRHADQLSVKNLAQETARLAVAARDGQLGMDDFAGGTFTVTALGMFGVDSFTPIINAPQAGILGVNRIYDGIGWDGDKPIKQRRMRLSLTWDHRVLDGAPAARFLGGVRDLLENPIRLLV